MKPNCKDPRWLEKRKVILERDEYQCQLCGIYKDECSNTILQVHHRYYIKGKEIWDYPNNLLVTLCKECHEHEGLEYKDIMRRIEVALKTHYLSISAYPIMARLIRQIQDENISHYVFEIDGEEHYIP